MVFVDHQQITLAIVAILIGFFSMIEVITTLL
jgi:hypothetical protein